MLEIIDFIESQKKKAFQDDALSLGKKLTFLKKIALYIQQNDIKNRIDEIVLLEDTGTGYSEYRVINDCESDNRSLWIEYKAKGSPLRLSPGDILIKFK